jgi:eukaryotic-like serine/threonine-protein kinase
MNEREIFLAALGKTDAAQRAAFLDEVRAADPDLRRQIDVLLAEHDKLGSFLEVPAAGHPSPPCGERQGVRGGPTRDQPITERPGTFIGPYKLLQQIGEGGMGTVFMAEQTQPLHRKVALKIIKPGLDSRQVIARFEAERQALAMMDHVNIARVFDGGATESSRHTPCAVAGDGTRSVPATLGRPYFVMELVHGVPITKYCDDNHLTPRERLELFVPVCQAIQHAHQKGVIHRDIKPSNVMVTLYDGKPVPKVIDFGVAKATEQKLTERTLFTQYGTMVGTLEYMSPEQAETSALGVDTRSDIYSLGVLLYELLTGSTPLTHKRMKEAAYAEILRMIKEEEPPKPSTRLSDSGEALASISANRHMEPAKLTKLVRGELDWIVMKCLEKDRNRRYETANGFAQDVQRYLADEQVQACPPSSWYRFRKFARRNRRALVPVSALVLAAFVGTGALAVSTVLVWKANKGLKESVERERFEAYCQRITVAHRELSTDNPAAALRALLECPESLRGWEWHYLMRLCKVDAVIIRVGTEVLGVAFSPDGELLASAGGDGTIKVWNSRTGELVRDLPAAHSDSVASVTFDPDGLYLASVGADKWVKVWDLATWKEEFRRPCNTVRKFGNACTVAFSPNGRRLAAGRDGTVMVWDWKKKDQAATTLDGHEKYAISVAFSPDGQRLASASTGRGVNLWDAQKWQRLRTFAAHPHPVSALAFSPDGGGLAEASLGRRVNLWDTTTGELSRSLVHDGNVLGVAYGPDGKRLATASEDKTVRVWDPVTGREMLGLRGHTGSCECVAFSRDGCRLASASTDGTIRVWDATPLRGNEGQEAWTFIEHDDEIRSVAVSPDGRRIASAGIGTLVKIWDAANDKPSVGFNVHANIVFSLTWHPDGQRIASAGWDGEVNSVRVWDSTDKRKGFLLARGGENSDVPYYAVACSPDGKHLVTGKGNGAVQVWDADTGRELCTLGTHKRELRGVAFSSEGKHLATASGDGKVKLWDATRLLKEQKARHTLTARVPGPSLNVAFSPDGRWLATGGEENTVKIWDTEKGGEPLKILRGHTGDVYVVAVCPDGRWVASAGEDSTVRVWDAHNEYRLARTFRGHMGLVSSLAFASGAGGLRLISGSRDKTVKVWDLKP